MDYYVIPDKPSEDDILSLITFISLSASDVIGERIGGVMDAWPADVPVTKAQSVGNMLYATYLLCRAHGSKLINGDVLDVISNALYLLIASKTWSHCIVAELDAACDILLIP
jgi:hypothetical protein